MFRKLARKLLQRYGYEVLGPPHSFAAHHTLSGLISQEKINLVLDVGANTGQFVRELRAGGYTGRILSFEPLLSAHAQLQKQAEADPNWTVADRTALGATSGSIEIHVSGNSVSSSILKMLPSHSDAAPESNYVATETVSLQRLDDICSLTENDRVMLKIDVQGYEAEVLDGASQVLSNCRSVISEMSLVPLYEGQILAREMWDLLVRHGFDAWSIEPAFRHPESGRMLQMDGIFVRSS